MSGRPSRPIASRSTSGASSSASSPTKRSSSQHLLPTPSNARSTSPLPRSPVTPSRKVFVPPPLHLTVRFSTSLPDLQLDILTPHLTTVVALKHQIRARLAADAASSSDPHHAAAARARLRFIHAGKLLPDHAPLSTVLKALPPPPASTPADPKNKGKNIEGRSHQRVYVICSIGDPLTPSELAAEAVSATATPTPASDSRPGTPGIHLDTGHGLGVRSTPAPAPAPRGFDRLLTTGFTRAEVNQLRLQFRSIQAARHTPDTMPSPDGLRRMEDQWIDSNAAGTAGMAASAAGEDGGAPVEEETGLNAVVEGMVKGMLIGFVFPLGAAGWLLREEGVWPRRMQVFVWLGVLLSMVMGMMIKLAGEG
ncbi:DUF2407 C-terminal domain-containing protein [Podospora conica]|nr:DUF2407 C-terminal domain-containing protein [Schizothecium conicum]